MLLQYYMSKASLTLHDSCCRLEQELEDSTVTMTLKLTCLLAYLTGLACDR